MKVTRKNRYSVVGKGKAYQPPREKVMKPKITMGSESSGEVYNVVLN